MKSVLNKKSCVPANPNVFNFYVYLRTHPLVIRQYLAASYQDRKKHTVVLSGFSYGVESGIKQQTSDRQVMQIRTYCMYLVSPMPHNVLINERAGTVLKPPVHNKISFEKMRFWDIYHCDNQVWNQNECTHFNPHYMF